MLRPNYPRESPPVSIQQQAVQPIQGCVAHLDSEGKTQITLYPTPPGLPFYGWYSLATSLTPTLRYPPTLRQSAVRVFSNAHKFLAAEDEHSGSATGDKLFWIRKQLLASEQGVVSYIPYPVPHTFALSGPAIRECHSAWTTSGTRRLAARTTDSRGSQPGTSQFRSTNIDRYAFHWKLTPAII